MTVKTTGYLRNSHTINADGNLNVSGYTVANNKDIVSGKLLTITTNTDLTNNANGNITGYTTRVDANNISNMGNLVATSQLNLNVANNIYNYLNMYTEGKAVINAKKLLILVLGRLWRGSGDSDRCKYNKYIWHCSW